MTVLAALFCAPSILCLAVRTEPRPPMNQTGISPGRLAAKAPELPEQSHPEDHQPIQPPQPYLHRPVQQLHRHARGAAVDDDRPSRLDGRQKQDREGDYRRLYHS